MKSLIIGKKIIKQVLRDKRSLAMIIVLPMVLMTLFYFVLKDNDYTPTISLIDGNKNIKTALDTNELDIKEYSLQESKNKLKENNIDGYIEIKDSKLILTLDDSEIYRSKNVISKLQESITNKYNNLTVDLEVAYLYNSDNLSMFESIGPIFIGFFAFLFVFFLSGISFVRERTTKTLEKIMVTQTKRYEIVLGYIIGFGFFALIQSIVIVTFSVKILSMYMQGSFYLVILTTFLISISSLTLGTFLSSFAKNEFQMMQMIPIIIVPQIIFTGVFPLDGLPSWIINIKNIFPLTFGADALKEIMIKGNGFWAIYLDLIVLVLFILVFMFLNMLVLKKERSI
ncbi:ABC transporter permease [Romboutsia weinsteinii]|uniref:ABC transporter permease n=1 Tax=Romboutsia weinsteinii TaxID=2020949 RepID=A0A371IZM8_9FIRM|nr:ABC transporter permease [Romboutsia weinsteinii]RDY26021.1 ABC transporter permease [Romboutsia weinsteinii]